VARGQLRPIGRMDATSQARLQLVLLVLAAWDLVAFALELTNTSLLEIGSVNGVLGARAYTGATLVLGLAYLYAASNPVRHRFVLWLATVEQVVAIFSAGFHWARGDLTGGETVLPIVASAVFLILLIANLPRQTDTL
jgi:hypothetical protein